MSDVSEVEQLAAEVFELKQDLREAREALQRIVNRYRPIPVNDPALDGDTAYAYRYGWWHQTAQSMRDEAEMALRRTV